MKNAKLFSSALYSLGRGPEKLLRTGLMILLFAYAMIMARTAKAQITVDGNPSDWPAVFSNPAYISTHIHDLVNSGSDDTWTQGSQITDPVSGWTWTPGNTNDKTDIGNAGIALINHSVYIFADLYATNGDASIGFWILKENCAPLANHKFSGAHEAGDLLVSIQFSNGGATATTRIARWNGTKLDTLTIGPGAAGAATNSTVQTVPSGWTYVSKAGAPGTYPNTSFFEGFVNLDSIGVAFDPCFSSFIVQTWNSQSDNASLADLAEGSFFTRPQVTVANDTVCQGSSATFTAVVTGGISPFTYSWNGGGFISSNMFTINPATVNTVVTVVAKGNNGCLSVPDTANLVVKPSPVITPIPDRNHCNGATGTAITFVSTPAGASFSWVGTRNVGFGTSGTVNPIPSYTATNTTSVTVTDTVIVNVTAAGCAGAPDTFLVTVYPTPGVAPHGDSTYCNGAHAGALSFTGTPGNVTYNWTSSANVGFGTSGTTNPIPAYTATNSGTVAVTATVIVTPSANGCTGKPDTFLITVNPTPNVAAHGDVAYCPNVLADSIHFNGNVVGTSFAWTGTANVGFNTSGTGTIPQFLTVNNGGSAVIDTVIVIPSANGCIGRADTFLVTVNPNPGPNAPIDNQAVCNNNLVDTIHLASLDPTIVIHWTSKLDLGFGTSGTGNIPAFIGSNGTSAPIVDTITVKSSTTIGCSTGDSTAFTITINPNASPNAPVDNFAICSGTHHDTIDIVGLDVVDTFHWTSTADIGFGTSGTGKIPAFTATVTPVQIVVTVSVTAVTPSGCPGETGGFVVTVNPLPVVVARDTSICAGVSFDLNLLSDPDGGTWSGTGASGTTFSSAGLGAGAHGLKYTFTDANTCTSSDSAYVTILSNPTVVARDTAICAGASVDLNLLSDPDGGTWTGSGVSGTTFNSVGLSGKIGLFYVYSNGAGCSGSDSAYITINPLPNVVARDTAICAGVSFSLNLLSDPDGGTWSGSGISGTTFNSVGLSGKIGLKYTYSDANTCTSSDSAYVTINPKPTVVANDGSVCAGATLDLNTLSDPDGGTWTGTGASGTTFNSAGLSLGKHGLLYTYTNGNGCTNSDSAYVTINSCGNVFATFTQGFWGSPGKQCDGAGTKRNATDLINYLLNLYGPITIGLPGRSVVIPITAASIVNAVMPGGKTPNKLTVAANVTISNTAGSVFATNYLTGGRINNVFLAQMISLKLGTRIIPGLLGFPIQYNPAGNSMFQTCGTSTSDCATFTVTGSGCACFSLKQSVTRYVTKGGTKTATLADLIAVADSLIGGGITPGTTVGGYVVPSYADMNDAIDLFNNAFDGFKSFSGSYGCPVPKEATASDLDAAMRIYPNPTTGTFSIEIPAIEKDAHITIVDLNGRPVMKVVLPASQYGQTQQVDMPRVSPGLYIIHVENDGHIFTRKIVVQ